MHKNLSQNKINFSKKFLFLSLYSTQFIGFGFFSEAFIAILRKNGMSLENLGLIYAIGIFGAFKFLWSPLVDKHSFFKGGHYKGWIFITQALMSLVFLSISFCDISHDIFFIIILAFIFGFLAATQTLSADAYLYKSVTKEQRTLGNSLRVAGGFIGTIIGGGGGLIVYAKIGWSMTTFILSLLVFLPLVHLYFQKEPVAKKTKETKQNSAWRDLYRFLFNKKEAMWILFLAVYPLGIGVSHGLISPMLVDIGWNLDKIGFVVHLIGYSVGILASFVVIAFTKKLNKKTVLIGCAIGQSFCVMLMLLFLNPHVHSYIVVCVVSLIFFFYTPSVVLISTYMMDKITNQQNIATQFALQYSLYFFFGVFASGLAVFLSGIFGYEKVIYAFFIVTFLGIYLSFKIDSIAHVKS